MRFTPTELTGPELSLQAEVREFLAAELPPGSHEPCLGMAADHDREFSAKMAARGWVGMALPSRWAARTAPPYSASSWWRRCCGGARRWGITGWATARPAT